MAVALLNANTMQVVVGTSVTDTTNMSVTNSGANRCAVIVISYDKATGESVTSVTYGGQTCISAGAAAHETGGNEYAELWYLVNPPTGLNTLAIVTAGGVSDIYYNLIAFTGVNQVTPVRAGTYGTNTGGGPTVSLTLSSNTNDLTITVANSGSSGMAATYTNQTGDGSNNGGSYGAASDHCTTAATSITHTYSASGATSGMAVAGFSINGDPNNAGGAWSGGGSRRAPGQKGPFDQRGFLLSPYQQYSYVASAAVAATALQRKTLSPLGTHTGGRQSQ